jgi:lysophospholipase L1-like esterase
MRQPLATAVLAVSLFAGLGAGAVQAADLIWEVESPFRFFKRTSAFELHERAFAAVRGAPGAALPANIVWRTERRLNDPDCRDSSTPTACANTARAQYETSRLGWAAQTVDLTCYDRNARPRRYSVVCERQYSWGSAKEDYILPDAHTVHVRLAPEHAAVAGECVWTWQPRRTGLPSEVRRQSCKDKLVIRRVPFSTNAGVSGVALKVQLPDGRQLAEPIVVEDLFVVALGDSFASGESNPDRPIVFSPAREMVYDPVNTREDVATRSMSQQPVYGIASVGTQFDSKSLPKRRMEDEEKGLIYRPASSEFVEAFERRSAQWLSADCHRSQYGYPFRVGIGLALENRHRAITFVSLACSGSDILEGLFQERDARERFSEPNGKKAPAQFDALSDLICRNGAAGRTRTAAYTLPDYTHGSAGIGSQTITKRWCLPELRKRPIDLVMLSIGGNDVGFGALALYAMTESAGDLAPIVGWVGHEVRFPPATAQAYLRVLDKRIKAVKDALVDGFGVNPAHVLHNAYEPIQFDESGNVCGVQPTLGLDVHPKFRFDITRVVEVSNFSRDLQARMECMSDARKRPGCPAGLATGAGTGFRFVTDHIAEFAKRGICARHPQRVRADETAMAMPRRSRETDDFFPYSPAHTIPYAAHWRLIRNPNDAFLAANLHREGISPFDLLQPAYAALFSGAFHPSAEGHAIVADHVLRHARDVLDKRSVAVVPAAAVPARVELNRDRPAAAPPPARPVAPPARPAALPDR